MDKINTKLSHGYGRADRYEQGVGRERERERRAIYVEELSNEEKEGWIGS